MMMMLVIVGHLWDQLRRSFCARPANIPDRYDHVMPYADGRDCRGVCRQSVAFLVLLC